MSKNSKAATRYTVDRFSSQYPSLFGSHASMIAKDWSDKSQDESFVVLADDHGFYATEKKVLDSGLADPYRYASPEFKSSLLRKLLPDMQISCQDGKISLAGKNVGS